MNSLKDLKFSPEAIEQCEFWLNKLKTNIVEVPLVTRFLKDFGHQEQCKTGTINSSITCLNAAILLKNKENPHPSGKWYIDDDSWLLFAVCLIRELRFNIPFFFQEVLRDGDALHPFFDLETKDSQEISTDLINELADVYVQMYKKAYVVEDLDASSFEFQILRNRKDPNRRIHVYFPHLVAEKKIHKHIVSQIKTDRPYFTFIDECMNGLRLPYMVKPGDYASVYLPNDIESVPVETIIKDLVLFRIRAYSWEPVPKMSELYSDHYKKINNNKRKFEPIDECIIDKLYELDNKDHFDLSAFRIEKKDTCLQLIRTGPSHCCICDRTHEHENMMVYTSRGCIMLKCFRNDKSRRIAHWRPSTVEEEQEHRNLQVDKILKRQYAPLYPTYIKEIVHTSKYVRAFDLEAKIQLICAAMGGGKTTALIDYLRALLQKYGSILILCSKRSYAIFAELLMNTHLPNIKFVCYLDESIKNEQYAIVQAESLHKVDRHYDVVIIDELTSFLAQMNSGLHGMYLQDNREKFEHLIRNAERVVGMDADMPLVNCEFIHKLRPNDEILLQKNMFKPSDRKVVWFNKDQKSYCWDLLIEKVANGERAGVILGSAKEGEKLAERFAAMHITCGYFYNENSVQANLNPGETIVDLWKRYQVVMYTSTITVGLDFNVPYFDCQFIFGNSFTNTVREIKQMMGRIRQLNSQTIYVCNKIRTDCFPSTYEAVRKEFLKKAEVDSANAIKLLTPNERELHLIDGRYVYEVKETIWTWLTHHCELERNLSRNYYNPMFRKMLELQGYTITDFTQADERELDSPGTVISDADALKQRKKREIEFLKEQKDLKEEVEKNLLDDFRKAEFLNPQDFKDAKIKVQKGLAKTELLRSVQRTEILLKIPKSTRDDTSVYEIVEVRKMSSLLYHAQIELCANVREQLFKEISRKEADPLFSKIMMIRELCEMLNIPNTLDRKVEIPCSTLRTKFTELCELFYKLNKVFKTRCKKLKTFADLKVCISSILNLWSGSKLSVKSQTDRKIKWNVYEKELLEKYNVEKIGDVPIFEWNSFINKKPDDEVRIYRYIYKLDTPSKYFDSHLMKRLEKLKEDNYSIDQLVQQLTKDPKK